MWLHEQAPSFCNTDTFIDSSFLAVVTHPIIRICPHAPTSSHHAPLIPIHTLTRMPHACVPTWESSPARHAICTTKHDDDQQQNSASSVWLVGLLPPAGYPASRSRVADPACWPLCIVAQQTWLLRCTFLILHFGKGWRACHPRVPVARRAMHSRLLNASAHTIVLAIAVASPSCLGRRLKTRGQQPVAAFHGTLCEWP